MTILAPLVLPIQQHAPQTYLWDQSQSPPHAFIQKPPYWDRDTGQFLNHIDVVLNYNFIELNQQDIDMRSKIYMTFLTHTERFLRSLLQGGNFNHDHSIYLTKTHCVYTSHQNNTPFGAWTMELKFPDKVITTQHSDIICIYAAASDTTYKEAIRILYDHINKNCPLFPASQDKASWFIQEKNPISIFSTFYYDEILNGLQQQLYPNNISIYKYNNKHNIPIALSANYTNNVGEPVTIFYTIQRRHNSPTLYFAPLPPDPPYMVYNIENIKPDTKNVYFHKNEGARLQNFYNDLIEVACPFGLDHLDNVDFSELQGKHVYVDWDGTPLEEGYLLRLKKRTEDLNIQLSFWRLYPFERIDIKSLLEQEKHIIPLQSACGYNKQGGITRAGEKIPNQDRVRKTILHPIIESGTITWLFSQEKVGKTLVSLSIAYAVGKGNKPVGNWNSKERLNVLFIDGEMPGDKIAKHCEQIMQGYSDHSGYRGRPFDCYLFNDNHLDYDSILDEEWLAEFKTSLFSYDLVILDNYYSLNENRLNIRPFIKLLKEMTMHDVAVIVVDHTNTEGELQGSQVKKRAADLGIKLNNVGENTISVELLFDRYGQSSNSPKHTLEKVFFSDRIQLLPTDVSATSIENAPQAFLTKRDKLLLFSYILVDIHGRKQKEVAEMLKLNSKRISEYVISARTIIQERTGKTGRQGKIPVKCKPSSPDLFYSASERMSNLSIDDILNELDNFCLEIDSHG